MTRKDGDSERGTEDIKDKDIEERKMNRNPEMKESAYMRIQSLRPFKA